MSETLICCRSSTKTRVFRMMNPNVRRPHNTRNPDHRYTIEEIILAVSFVTVFSLLLIPCEKVSGSPVPTVLFHGGASFFQTFVLALNFAFCGAVMTIFLRHLYPGVAIYTKFVSILSMAVAVGVISWLAVPLVFQRAASLLVSGHAIAE